MSIIIGDHSYYSICGERSVSYEDKTVNLFDFNSLRKDKKFIVDLNWNMYTKATFRKRTVGE